MKQLRKKGEQNKNKIQNCVLNVTMLGYFNFCKYKILDITCIFHCCDTRLYVFFFFLFFVFFVFFCVRFFIDKQ